MYLYMMKLIITENQYRRLLNESTEGLDIFIQKIVEAFPSVTEYVDIIKNNIESSNCQKIEFSKMRMAGGLSLHDRVLISDDYVNPKTSNISKLMYIIFHEIAHQHQYKKYGKELIYDMYIGEIDMEGAIMFLRYIENVADQFGMRKCRELKRLGVIPEGQKLIEVGAYDNYNDKMFEDYINLLKSKVTSAGVTKPEDISELIYNLVKVKL